MFNKSKFLALTLLAVLLSGCGDATVAQNAADSTEAQPMPDLVTPYKRIGDVELVAHLFYPEGHTIDDEVAVLVFLHGGGLRRGSPTQGYEFASELTPQGVAVVSIQYRLLDTNATTLDQLISDAKSAIRWLRTNSDALGIDPNRIAMSGHSAGAYLTLATGVIDKFDQASEDMSISSVPNAMILWSVPVARTDDPEHSMVPAGFSMADFVPANYPLDSLPPALFIHGDADTTVAYEPAMEFEAIYAEAGNDSEFHLIPGADHFFREPMQRAQVHEFFSGYLAQIGYSNP